MPTNYSGNGTSYPVNVPLPNDGEPAAAAFLAPAWQRLADRTAWLKLAIATEVADRAADVDDEAATRLAQVQTLSSVLYAIADLATLAAIPTPADTAQRHVKGYGFYVFDSSVVTGAAPFCVTANDGTVGRWVSSTAHETSMVRYVPCNRIIGVTSTATTPTILNVVTQPLAIADVTFSGAGAFVTLRASTHATNAWGFLLPLSDHLIDGASLDSATLRWAPGGAVAPTVLAQMAIVRSVKAAATTGTGTPLLSTGFKIDTGGTYGALVDRDLVYTTDQNKVIDLATYTYAAVIYDEHGTNATFGNYFHHVALAMSGIPDAARR